MFIEIIPNRKSPATILLRESYYEDGKSKKRTIANLSHLDPLIIENLRQAFKADSPLILPTDSFEIIQSTPHGHVEAILEIICDLELRKFISNRNMHKRDIIIALIVSRLISPASKLATASSLNQEIALNSIPSCLNLGPITEDDFYEAMDWFLLRQDAIENQLAKRHLHDGCLILYDVSSSYFEGKKCPLALHGYNRDKKKGKLQIVYGVLTDIHGCPIAVEVFPGNTGDSSTVASQIRKIQKRFGLKEVILIGDRGMITEARLREDFLTTDGIEWITALRAPAIKDLLIKKAFQPSLFDEMRIGEIRHPEYPNERLIICKNTELAMERKRNREELLAATEKELEKVEKATLRSKKPLRGKAEIGLRVGKVLGKFKMGKHFRITIREDSFSYSRKLENIETERATDGFYILRTSISDTRMGPEEVVRAYKNLSKVERAFRCLKGIDLRIRPIYHRLEDRVRSHVFICMLAYYVEWHMRRRLAPLMYTDEFKELGEKERETVVDAAKRSSLGNKKVASGKTLEGEFPLEDFQTILKNLGTITRNTVQPKGNNRKPFTMVSTPTKLQKKALDLLKKKSVQ